MNRILVVDDDDELRLNMSAILKASGYAVDDASNGNEALRKMQSEEFDVVMLDFMLPGLKGTDVLEEIKKSSPRTKVIMITAFATIENAIDAIKKGASEYISKPFKVSELLMTVKRVLEEARFEEDTKGLDLDYAFSSLSNPIRRNIIQMLHARSGMRLMELTRELEIEDHTKVIFHLRVLRDAGLITQSGDKTYMLTNEGKQVLDCLQIVKKRLAIT